MKTDVAFEDLQKMLDALEGKLVPWQIEQAVKRLKSLPTANGVTVICTKLGGTELSLGMRDFDCVRHVKKAIQDNDGHTISAQHLFLTNTDVPSELTDEQVLGSLLHRDEETLQLLLTLEDPKPKAMALWELTGSNIWYT